MLGKCKFTNYMLSMLIILSNMSTAFFIYPVVYDYIITYNKEININIGLQIGVSIFINY